MGFDPLGLRPESPTYDKISPEFVELRNQELQNGRLAMIGIAGMIAQELVDKRQIIAHLQEFGLRYVPASQLLI